jgi:hypothetical protein
MAKKTVLGLLDNHGDAQKAVDELLQNGFRKADIGVVSSRMVDETMAAASGATKGMALGGVAGMLLAAATLLIPGIGPVLAAGPALTLLAGTTFGAVTGGLIMGLTEKGVPEADAQFYAEGLRRGGTLIIVVARNDERAERAVEILKRHGAVDVEQRTAEWKALGWNGKFEPRDDKTRTSATAAAAPAGSQAFASRASSRMPAQQSASASSGSPAQQTASASSGASARPAAQPAPVASDIQPTSAATRPQAATRSGSAGAGEVGEPAVLMSAVSVYAFVLDGPDDADARRP